MIQTFFFCVAVNICGHVNICMGSIAVGECGELDYFCLSLSL